MGVRDDGRVDEREGLVSSEQCFSGCEGVSGERVNVQSGVLLDAVEEVDGRLVTRVGGQPVERLGEHVIEDNALGK